MPNWLTKILSKFAFTAPKRMWFKSESAAFAAAITQFVLVWFGADISWIEGTVTTLATYAAAYVTVRATNDP
jgi:hypothetical protein